MPQIRTSQEILNELNTQHGQGWIVGSDIYGAPVTNIVGPNRIELSSSGAIVLQAFVNERTAEVRFYWAKLISDTPHRESL